MLILELKVLITLIFNDLGGGGIDSKKYFASYFFLLQIISSAPFPGSQIDQITLKTVTVLVWFFF